ncbi:serine/threonine protein kinase [Dactylosporangium sp. NBC_01737]|uniref:serine/threonine-protein kinase n=1 Tax=Dactylosporangium sp. NBC_01737 TaxID=2975959 RepID=UPI002E137E0D|nr:serine/threonine protein kinase [Dactylosporangium sp. NBC_01737]
MRTPPEARDDTDDHLRSLSEDLTGYRIGDAYQLIEPIGGGGTGTVWRARALQGDGEVAVKLLREDLMAEPKAVSRFVQERAILLMLRHPHIVRVRDLVTVGTSLGLVMDLVEGGSLRDHLHEQGTLAPAAAATLLAQVADALSAAHRRGIVHRDLKPDNILLDRDDGRLHTRLTDFGIARVLDTPSMTTPGALVGTANYIAPEAVYGGRPAPSADVYALGVVLFELVTGRPPYAGGPAWAILRRHVDESPQRVEGMPEAVWRVVEACMDKRPGRRPSAKELAHTLRVVAKRTADDQPLPPQPVIHELPSFEPPLPKPRPPTSSRSRMTVLAVVLAAVTVVAVPAWRIVHRPSAETAVQRPDAPPPSADGQAAKPQPSGLPSAGGSRTPGGARLGAGAPTRSAGPVEAIVWSAWQCADQYTWDIGHPLLAQPCHQTSGVAVRMVGHAQALPAIQADISISLMDADSGAVVDGPHTCTELMFTDFAPNHDCGPFDATPPRGHRYFVLQKWVYTNRAILPGGQVSGPEFDW